MQFDGVFLRFLMEDRLGQDRHFAAPKGLTFAGSSAILRTFAEFLRFLTPALPRIQKTTATVWVLPIL